jgi:hypothetical protein
LLSFLPFVKIKLFNLIPVVVVFDENFVKTSLIRTRNMRKNIANKEYHKRQNSFLAPNSFIFKNVFAIFFDNLIG